MIAFQSPLHRGSLWNRRLAYPGSRISNLSVPSSSGKSLERRKRAVLLGSMFPFSPLFIGEVSGTTERGERLQGLLTLSVPSSSGKSLEHKANALPFTSSLPFSPLFIGEVSGTSLRRHSILLFQPFSPLFIGEVSGTGDSRAPRGGQLPFQSPLHRGSLWNFHLVPAKLRYLTFQSPLHRGSLWNAAENQLTVNVDVTFSPLFIGEVSGTAFLLIILYRNVHLSVPSSSGKSLELVKTPSMKDSYYAFSPLFIGEVSGTGALETPKSGRIFLSVPSSSGKSLEPRNRLL